MKIEMAPERYTLPSAFLQREVIVDFYWPPEKNNLDETHLLLVNDGQDLVKMNFNHIIETLFEENQVKALFCVGIHCGSDRKNEYGTANFLNAKGLGKKALLYTHFVLEELVPFIQKKSGVTLFLSKSFCGFSLGALSALDIVWGHPGEFSKVGAFSGSFWWRSVAQDDIAFDENIHRIMHIKIRNGDYYPWLKFFFETGTLDEIADRNHNGIIDSIDDTVSLIEELEKKGYNRQTDIRYLELPDGSHDVATWGRVFPEFLKWGWGK